MENGCRRLHVVGMIVWWNSESALDRRTVPVGSTPVGVRSGNLDDSTFRNDSSGSIPNSSSYVSFMLSLTLAMSLASWPRLMVTQATSRRNLRMVENEQWQTPLR